ncbi:M15 family metallopeptidase [Roseomonas sp. BU-1]|uniref:M15 family metallopeptidase n=1 Tax=Falsiroseomonas selenitidurans TaxID=2716335 RepID=A0ABX1DZC2_9PROT|nr:M15 family metallopeptidase [Falsiroseomonas selenitidurans]
MAPELLTPRDLERLRGVHPDLVRVIRRARRDAAFFVIEGVRSAERQRVLVAGGASRTQNSRHLTGHAVDLGPIPLDWQNIDSFRAIARVVQAAAEAEGVSIRWGGSFTGFFDGPHFELTWAAYPV